MFGSKNITILGTGAYGTVLANVLTDNGHSVIMYGIQEDEVNDINNNNLNSKYFGSYKINKKIKATLDFKKAIKNADYIIFSVPVVVIKSLIAQINIELKHSVVFINVAKGLDPVSFQPLSNTFNILLNPKINKGYVGIYGPSIAQEVIERKPTCIMSVSETKELAAEVKKLFNNEYFKTFVDTDVVGVEYAVALKNSIAIATGMFNYFCDSDNAKASIITMGLNEVCQLAIANGAKKETFLNYAALGDLLLTASSPKSRNYSLGYEIAEKNDAKVVLAAHSKTVEGVLTCKTVYEIVKNQKLDLPLFQTLYNILYKNSEPKRSIMSIFKKLK